MELDAALRGTSDVHAAGASVLDWLVERGARSGAVLLHDGVATYRVVAWRGGATIVDAVPTSAATTIAAAPARTPGARPDLRSFPVTDPAAAAPGTVGTRLVGLVRVTDPGPEVTAAADTAAQRFTTWWVAHGRPVPATAGRDLADLALGLLADDTSDAVEARLLAGAVRLTGLRTAAVVTATPHPGIRAVTGPLDGRLARLTPETLRDLLTAEMAGRIRYGGPPLVEGTQAQLVVRPSPGPEMALLLVDARPWTPAPEALEQVDMFTALATARLSGLRDTDAVRTAEEHFRNIVEQSPDVVVIVGADGRCRYVSPSCRDVLGYEPDALRGRPAAEFVHPDDRGLVTALMREVLRGTRRTVRVTHRTPHEQGHVVWLESVAIGRRGRHGELDRLQIVARDVSATKAETDRLGRLATEDHLTGLGNRAQLLQELRRSLDTAATSTALLFLDLDDFKPINDRLGHAVGDQLLVQIAARLRHAVRPGDVVSRFGGDEFVILCPGIGELGTAERLASRIVEVLAEPFALETHELSVSASIGLALSSEHTASAEALLADADAAMYRAKTSRRGSYMVAESADPPAGGKT